MGCSHVYYNVRAFPLSNKGMAYQLSRSLYKSTSSLAAFHRVGFVGDLLPRKIRTVA